jgi:hypothetical protein
MEKRSQHASDGFLLPLHVLSKRSMLAFKKGSFSFISECIMRFLLDIRALLGSSTALTPNLFFSFFTTALAVLCGSIFLPLVRAEDANGSKERDAFLFSRSLKGEDPSDELSNCPSCLFFLYAIHFIDSAGNCQEECVFIDSVARDAGWECGLCEVRPNPPTPNPPTPNPPTPNPPTPNPPTPNPPTPNPPTPTGAGVGIELRNGAESDKFSLEPQDMDIFFISVPSSSTVTCTTDADNGDLDLYMNQIGLPESYDCTSDSLLSLESCTISAGPGNTYAFTFAFTQVSDYTVTCTIEEALGLKYSLKASKGTP